MASKFINVVTSGALAAGASISVAHGLNHDSVALTPHVFDPSRGDFTVTVDDTNVNFTNNNAAAQTCTCFVEWFHSFQQVFGAAGLQTIAGLPFNLGGAAASGAGGGDLQDAYDAGPAAGAIIALDSTRDGIYVRYANGILNAVMLALQDSAGGATYFDVRGSGLSENGTINLNGWSRIQAVNDTSGASEDTARVTGVANATPFTAATEVSQLRVNAAQTHTWAAGNIAVQRTVRIQAETIEIAGGASGVLDAATVAISGPPIAGGGTVIVDAWALKIESGNIRNVGDYYFGSDFTGTPAGRLVYSAGTVSLVAMGARNALGDSPALNLGVSQGTLPGAYGGAVLVRSGAGVASDATSPGGNAGALTIETGAGGAASTPEAAGSVGLLNITGGAGGAGSGAVAPSDGGTIVITAGPGGAAGATSLGAAGGTLQLNAGPGSDGSAVGVAGNGGALQITAGNGGADAGGGSGDGGSVTIDAGASGGAAGATGGDVTIQAGSGSVASEGGSILLRTNALTRIEVGVDAEAANETAVYISVNAVSKRIHAKALGAITTELLLCVDA